MCFEIMYIVYMSWCWTDGVGSQNIQLLLAQSLYSKQTHYLYMYSCLKSDKQIAQLQVHIEKKNKTVTHN